MTDGGTCAHCGARLPADARWCSLCLQPVTPPEPDADAPPAPAPAGSSVGDGPPAPGESPEVGELLAQLAAYERAPLAGGWLGPLGGSGGHRNLAMFGLLGAVLVVLVLMLALLGWLL